MLNCYRDYLLQSMIIRTITVNFKINVEILQINQHSSSIDIKKAYFKLAKKYHPDVNKAPDANERFSEINKDA